ncbi:glycerol-3-phosphate dehydrogenase subunit GlpB, partial [Aeromonas veronii]
ILTGGERNHRRLTPIGTLKETWLSPDTCAIAGDTPQPERLMLATLEGFRDFHPALAAANLANQPGFANTRILTG